MPRYTGRRGDFWGPAGYGAMHEGGGGVPIVCVCIPPLCSSLNLLCRDHNATIHF